MNTKADVLIIDGQGCWGRDWLEGITDVEVFFDLCEC